MKKPCPLQLMQSRIIGYIATALLVGVTATVMALRANRATRTKPTRSVIVVPDDRSMTDLIVNTSKSAIKGDLQTLYQIKKGDTLFRISQKYGVSVQAIKDANRDKSDVIAVDQWIVIPK
ncbi:MAG: LysM peptidoglycan-binding domain-containing protein [Akkermansiaceae bacterium]|nr:LysM peptidoglycan-binding domain-containing protein [Akkermansiaceae bacterium]